MQTLSIDQFKNLIASRDWQHTQELETIEIVDRPIYDMGDLIETVTNISGHATKTSSLGNIEIVYCETYNYDDCMPDSLHTSTDGLDVVWAIRGVKVIDDDGDELDAYDLAELLSATFSEIDYGQLNIDRVEEVDSTESDDFKTYTLQIDNAPNIKFKGQLIASVSSSDNNASGSSYSGESGRWTELSLYRTAGGRYICHQVGRTRWTGERDRFTGKVCDHHGYVREFFGYRWLAKELYAKAGIEDTVYVD